MFEFSQPSTESKTAISLKQKKPGPRPNRCIWCNEVQCSHCQCPGYPKCDHRPGEPCQRQRYKRRLVCNSCEKNKLKDEPVKKTKSQSSSRDSNSILKKKSMKGHLQISKSLDNTITHHHNSQGHYSFGALLRVANEMHQAESQNTLSSPTYEISPSTIHGDDVGLCMDSVGTSSVSELNNNNAEEVVYNSNHTTPVPPTTFTYYPSSMVQQQYSTIPPTGVPYYPSGENPYYNYNTLQRPLIPSYDMSQPVNESVTTTPHPTTQCTIFSKQPCNEYPIFPFRGM